MKTTEKPNKSLTQRIMGIVCTLVLGFTTAFQPIAVASVSAQQSDAGAANNYVQITSENAHTPKLIRLGLNKALVVDLPSPANDILVANPEVADAVMRTSRRVYLFGKEQGQTNIFVFDNTGKQIAAIEIIIERDITSLEETLSRLIENSNIKVEMISGSIVLTGTVSTPADSAKAASLASIFVSNQEVAGSFFTQITDNDIVNLLKIEGEDQVHLKVVIAEVTRAVVKQLGITTQYANPSTSGLGFTALGQPSRAMNAAFGASSLLGTVSHGVNTLQSQLDAMETAGVIRTLSEPSLTAVSGESATFEVGGEAQVASSISEEEGTTSVSYTEQTYGVKLEFTPVVLTAGRISLRLSTEVEEPTPIGAGTLGRIGGLMATRKRAAATTVELPSGGSMAIAGLIQDDIRQSVSGTPGFARIPILGSLFRSREFARNETELVIIVTPYLVRPTSLKNLVRPDEGFQPASDAAGMFMGRVNRVYGIKQGNLPKGRYTGTPGFIMK